VLKATWKKDALHDKVKGEIAWALKTVIRSFGNACDIKRIKGELCPSVLSTGEWPTWNDKAREILRNDSSFGVDPEHVEVFTVRERPVSREEKLFNEFKAERDFFERVQTIRNFAAIKNVEPDTEYFAEMFAYLSGYLKSGAPVDEKTVSSYFMVKDLTAKFPSLGPGVKTDFPELFAQIEDAPRVYENLKDYRLKDTFLKHIQMFIPGWEDIYLKLFPRDPQPAIIAALEKEGARDKLAALTAGCFENYRESKEAAFWLFKNSGGTPWYKQAGVSDDKQLITLVHILDLCYKEIENHRDTSKNRKLSRTVYAALFEEGLIDTFLGGADQDNALRLYTLINDVKDLDPADKMTLKNKIAAKYPDIKFSGDMEKKVSRGLIVTLAMYEEKKRQLARLMTEEIPANSKEIEFALSLGDLRENAEYKAAKEKQTLLNTTAAKLQDEIDRAQVFDPSTVNANRVSFGTRVALLNETSGEREEYTILGPWESDPENKVISYLSPFGAAVLNKAAGDKVDFAIGKEKIVYKVEKISPAV
jgi:transcription elongation factor GreA